MIGLLQLIAYFILGLCGIVVAILVISATISVVKQQTNKGSDNDNGDYWHKDDKN